MKNIFLIIVLVLTVPKSFAQNTVITTSGDVLQLAIPAAAFASTLIWKEEGTQPTWQFVKAYGSSFVIEQALKHIVQKPRPDGSDNLSFPSGHTTSAFSGAAFIQRKYGWKYGVPSYILASYVGYTRIQAKKTRRLGCACRSHNWYRNSLFIYQAVSKKSSRCIATKNQWRFDDALLLYFLEKTKHEYSTTSKLFPKFAHA